jgi:hypothetical protein
MSRDMSIEGSLERGTSVRATSLTTSLDPRRDGHALDCLGCSTCPERRQRSGS